jgi:hypothetical protein
MKDEVQQGRDGRRLTPVSGLTGKEEWWYGDGRKKG